MKKVTIAETGKAGFGGDSSRRALAEPLNTSAIALNYYRIAPGDGLPAGLHAHMDQEELFFALDGRLTFETLDGEITVRASEVIRFAPGEFQSGINRSESEAVVLALGVPRESEDIRIPVDCSQCSHETLRLDLDGSLTFLCPNCSTEYEPADCPDCGDDDLQITLDEKKETIVVCQNCGSEFERPPLKN